MCFSAKASFFAAGGLMLVGTLSIKKANHHKSLLPFAGTPLFFGVQQMCEGLVWLGLSHTIPLEIYKIAAYSFVSFAGIWWPLWVPWTLYILENNKQRKKIMLTTIIIGTITSFIYLIGLITQQMEIIILNHHLYYSILSHPLKSTTLLSQYIENVKGYMYLYATVSPFFISSISHVWLIGIVMGGACLMSEVFYPTTVASTWCFFAAVASILMYIIITQQKKGPSYEEVT